jgi:hypothetical protein
MEYSPDSFLVCHKVEGSFRLMPYSNIDDVHKALDEGDAAQVFWAVVGTGFKIACDTLAEAKIRQERCKTPAEIQLFEPRRSLSSAGRQCYYTAPTA